MARASEARPSPAESRSATETRFRSVRCWSSIMRQGPACRPRQLSIRQLAKGLLAELLVHPLAVRAGGSAEACDGEMKAGAKLVRVPFLRYRISPQRAAQPHRWIWLLA